MLWKQHIVKTQQLKMFSKQIHFDHFLISDQGGYTMPERSCKKRVPLNFFIQNFVERKSTHGKSDETVRYFFGDLSSITALPPTPLSPSHWQPLNPRPSASPPPRPRELSLLLRHLLVHTPTTQFSPRRYPAFPPSPGSTKF